MMEIDTTTGYKAYLLKVVDDLVVMHADRAKDYNIGTRIDDYFPTGMPGYAQIIFMKAKRLQAGVQAERWSSVNDSIIDLLNYAVFAKFKLEQSGADIYAYTQGTPGVGLPSDAQNDKIPADPIANKLHKNTSLTYTSLAVIRRALTGILQDNASNCRVRTVVAACAVIDAQGDILGCYTPYVNMPISQLAGPDEAMLPKCACKNPGANDSTGCIGAHAEQLAVLNTTEKWNAIIVSERPCRACMKTVLAANPNAVLIIYDNINGAFIREEWVPSVSPLAWEPNP